MFNTIKIYFEKRIENELLDVLQKTAWRLVRSAEDRFEAGDGKDKRKWCETRMAVHFPEISGEVLEDTIRAAYFNLTIENGTHNKRTKKDA